MRFRDPSLAWSKANYIFHIWRLKVINVYGDKCNFRDLLWGCCKWEVCYVNQWSRSKRNLAKEWSKHHIATKIEISPLHLIPLLWSATVNFQKYGVEAQRIGNLTLVDLGFVFLNTYHAGILGLSFDTVVSILCLSYFISDDKPHLNSSWLKIDLTQINRNETFARIARSREKRLGYKALVMATMFFGDVRGWFWPILPQTCLG